jgi:hypothetical protein
MLVKMYWAGNGGALTEWADRCDHTERLSVASGFHVLRYWKDFASHLGRDATSSLGNLI